MHAAPRRQGRTQAQRAAAQAAGGFNVWRSYDAADGIRDELYSIAQRNPQIVKLEVIGHTLQGREIIALKVTKNAQDDRRRHAAGRPLHVARSTRASGSRRR